MKPQIGGQLLACAFVNEQCPANSNVPSRVVRDTRERIATMVGKIPDDRLLLEIDVLPRTAAALASEVCRGSLDDIASIRSLSLEEAGALNRQNVRELVGDSSRVAEITALLKQS